MKNFIKFIQDHGVIAYSKDGIIIMLVEYTTVYSNDVYYEKHKVTKISEIKSILGY